MLTIHASKGLEFSAVHLPGLGEGKFPSGKRPDRCPPPAGLLSEEMLDWEGEEEECLFFVAISRAQDHLCISRARQYGKRESRESPLLQLVRGRLPKAVVKPKSTVALQGKRSERITNQTAAQPFYEQELRDYLVCPLKYYYRHLLKISDRRSDSPYAQSHLCVHRMWQFIEGELESSQPIDDAVLMSAFDETWNNFGPVGHAYEADYRQDAAAIVRRTLARRSAAGSLLLRPTWLLKTEAGVIIVRPDYVEVNDSPEGRIILIQDLHFGSAPNKAPSNDYFALYAAAAEQTFPSAKIKIQAVYVSNGETFDVNINSDKRKAALRIYQNAIQGILRGEFSPRPTEKGCPRCPGYHLCPAAEIHPELVR
jgi:CRISPR/Cas system-associated exonuclease Cas4 (RecB family)